MLVKNAGREIDLSTLQFLRRAIGNFPIHPQGESFDLRRREQAEGDYNMMFGWHGRGVEVAAAKVRMIVISSE